MAAFASAIGLTGAFAGETQPGTLCDSPGAAIRSGDWKLIEFYEFDEVELYRLDQDVGERRDLSLIYPEKKEALRLALKGWQSRMNAQMPVLAD